MSKEKKPKMNLILTGTHGVTDEEERNRIITVNKISFAVSISILIIASVILYFAPFSLSLFIPLILDFSLNFSVPFLNHRKQHRRAGTVLYFTQAAALGYFGYTLAALLQLEYAIVLLIAINYLVMKNSLLRKIGLACALIDLAIIEYAHFKTPPGTDLGLSYNISFFIHALVVISIISITILVSVPYVRNTDLRYERDRAIRFIRIFTAQVAHELRTPLNAVHQIAQLIKAEVTKDKGLKKIEPLADMSLAASMHTRNIVNNVLNMAEIESGKMETITKEAFLIQAFLDQLIGVHKVIAETEQIKLKMSIEGMPPVIISDPLNLSQIITNLLANAIKYGNDNSTVLITVNGRDDQWTLQITNQGPGIPHEKLDSIFDPFTTFKDIRAEGSGLGLYIVRHKVAALGGTIRVESVPNRQTTFTVTLPLITGKLASLRKAEEAKEESLVDLRETHVLIAEDHKLSALLLCMHLDEMGCKVTAVKNGQELLRAVEQNRPDIIIMDQHMPVMGGAETTRQLKMNPSFKDIPIIVSTGDLFTDSLDRILEAGADTYIEKPVDIKSLKKVILRYLPQKNR